MENFQSFIDGVAFGDRAEVEHHAGFEQRDSLVARAEDYVRVADAGEGVREARRIGQVFFAAGFDRWLMRAMVGSLETIPPGAWHLSLGAFEMVTHLLSASLEMGVRLALPVTGFLLVIDLTLAVVSRLNAQFPLLNIAFPLKTGLAALALGATIGLVQGSYARLMEIAGEALGGVMRWP